METKSFLQSSTFWLNILGPVFLWLATKFGLDIDQETQLAIITVVMAVINIIVRWFGKDSETLTFSWPKHLPPPID